MKSPEIHRTPIYRAKAAYRNMVARCGNANGKNPSYTDVELRMTLEEWLNWAIPKYEKFITDYPDTSPNVSRFGDQGHYEVDNIEITSFKVNRDALKTPGNGSQDLVCPACDARFSRTNRYIKGKLGEGVARLFCSQSCRSKSLRV